MKYLDDSSVSFSLTNELAILLQNTVAILRASDVIFFAKAACGKTIKWLKPQSQFTINPHLHDSYQCTHHWTNSNKFFRNWRKFCKLRSSCTGYNWERMFLWSCRRNSQLDNLSNRNVFRLLRNHFLKITLTVPSCLTLIVDVTSEISSSTDTSAGTLTLRSRVNRAATFLTACIAVGIEFVHRTCLRGSLVVAGIGWYALVRILMTNVTVFADTPWFHRTFFTLVCVKTSVLTLRSIVRENLVVWTDLFTISDLTLHDGKKRDDDNQENQPHRHDLKYD